MNQESARSALLLQISRISLVLDDLRLFLDTHPDEADAIAYYNECVKAREALVLEYDHAYGPLNTYAPNVSCDSWANAALPMPWEGV